MHTGTHHVGGGRHRQGLTAECSARRTHLEMHGLLAAAPDSARRDGAVRRAVVMPEEGRLLVHPMDEERHSGAAREAADSEVEPGAPGRAAAVGRGPDVELLRPALRDAVEARAESSSARAHATRTRVHTLCA